MMYQVNHNRPQTANVTHVIYRGDDYAKAQEAFTNTKGGGMFQFWTSGVLVDERHDPIPQPKPKAKTRK